jgi:hypothetical protein
MVVCFFGVLVDLVNRVFSDMPDRRVGDCFFFWVVVEGMKLSQSQDQSEEVLLFKV